VIRAVIRHLPLTIAAAGLFGLLLIPVAAQETPGPGRAAQGGGGGGTPGPGRGRGAAAGPKKPTPRLPDGHVNLGAPAGGSGFWGGGGSIVGKRGSSLPTNPDVSEVPFQPWAKALYEVRQKVGDKDDPHARCLPPGGPRQFQTPNGFEFIEQPDRKRITIIFGYSTGKWMGDTLVVESTGYNEKFWFHRGGLPHTDALHLTERFSRPDFDTLKYEVTVDDPKAYTRPWTGGFTVPWTYTNWDGSPGGEMHEYLCQDNERDYSKLR